MIKPDFFIALIAVFFVIVFCACMRKSKKEIDKENKREWFV